MITTPLDSATLDSKEQYVFYHKMVDFALKELLVNVQKTTIVQSARINFFQTIFRLVIVFNRSNAS